MTEKYLSSTKNFYFVILEGEAARELLKKFDGIPSQSPLFVAWFNTLSCLLSFVFLIFI